MRILSLVLVFSLLFVFGTEAFAKCKRIQGTSSGIILDSSDPDCDSPLFAGIPSCFTGAVNGSLKGEVSLVLTDVFPTPNPGVFVFLGTTILTAANGDELFGVDTISVDADGNAADLVVWTGGNGQFAGATGHVVIDGESDFANNTFETDWYGEICTP